MTRKAVSIRKKKKSGSRADARKRELLARVSTLLTEASSSEKEPCSEVKLLSCDLSAEDSGPPPKKKLKLSEEEFQKRCLEFQARRKEIMSRPKVFLVARGLSAELTLTDNARVPILFSDIQSLLLYSQIGDIGPLKPRWLKILRWKTTSHVICVVVDPLAMRHVDELASDQKIQEAFTSRVEVVSPLRYDSSVPEELMLVPLSMNRRYKLTRAYGSIEGAVASGTLMQRMRAFFPITKDNNNMAAPIQDEPSAFSRLDLLLNVEQMLREKYPFPSNRAGAGRLDPVDELESSSCSGRSSDAGFRHSRSSYAEVTSNSPLFSLDCEMCQTASGEKVLTRVAVVDEDLKLVYHSFVKPHEEITDYLTEYSGVTPEMLFGVTKRLEDVQRELEEILPPDAILVGHSLSNDLHALKIFHPYVIDTSVIYNLSGERSRKPKLAVLASSFLDLEIQTGGKLGHNPAEDSYATMKLLKLKLEKGYRFGDCVIDGPANDINPRAPHNFSELIFHFIRDRKVNVIGKSSVLSQYRSCLNQFRSSSNVELVEASCNKHIVTAVQDALPKGHLTIGHFCDAKEQNEAALISLTQKRLKRVWDSAPAKSIVLAILPGNQQENGACLLGVKE